MFTYTDDDGDITFGFYKKFRKSFLERFTDSNLTGSAMKRLLNLRKRKMDVQEYITKILNLSYQADLRDQATKILVFRRLHSKDQDRIMLANSIKTETELQKKSMEIYLKRIIRLLRHEEVWRQNEKQEDSAGSSTYKSAIWKQEEDLIELNVIKAEKKIRKYFKYRKTEHVWKNYK